MGDLREELIKKGLISSKKAKQLSHEDRSRKKKLGKDAVAAETSRREAERRAAEESRRDDDRRRELGRRDAETEREERSRVVQLLTDHARSDGIAGPRRFHFVSRSQRILFLELNEETARGLEHGELAICEVPDSNPERFVIVPSEAARRAREIEPDYVLFIL